MKKLCQRLILGIFALGVLAGFGYMLAIVGWTKNPHGKYASYEFFGHALTDVLRFENGKVTLETCCGNEAYGTYAKDPTGGWIWTQQQQVRPADRAKWHMTPPRRFRLHRSLFFLRIDSLDQPAFQLDMQRRLFNQIPL